MKLMESCLTNRSQSVPINNHHSKLLQFLGHSYLVNTSMTVHLFVLKLKPYCTGIDRYRFFRADMIPIFRSSALADDWYANTNFLEPIFGADTAFAPSIYILKMTLMITNVTSLNLKKEHQSRCCLRIDQKSNGWSQNDWQKCCLQIMCLKQSADSCLRHMLFCKTIWPTNDHCSRNWRL